MSAVTHFGASIQIISTIAPASAPAQTTSEDRVGERAVRTSSANGV